MLIRRLVAFVGCAGKLGATPGDKLRILWKLTKNLRVRAGLGHHHPAEVYSIHTRQGPLFLRDNFGDITNVVTLIYRDAYRARRLPSPGVILDAGANIGLAAAWLGWHNPDLAVYCFEPIPESAQLIRRNCPRAVVINKALGDRKGNVRLRVDEDNVIASSIETAWRTREVEFEVTTLDDFTREHAISRVALLKIDVEGMENAILAGAAGALSRTAEVVMETHGRDRHERARQQLSGAGFRIDSESFGRSTGMIFASRDSA